MATQYLNGGHISLPGFIFTTPQELIDQMEQTLTGQTIVTVGAGGASGGATNVPLKAPFPKHLITSGTVLDFGGGKTATLSANCNPEDASITVDALGSALIEDETATVDLSLWTSLAKTATSLFVKGETVVGNYNCWVEFTVTGTNPNYTLFMQGWLEEAKINGSGLFALREKSTVTTFEGSLNNRLWLTCDEDSLCLSIFNAGTGNMFGAHFGFCDRIDTTDEWAIYMGYLGVQAYVEARVAKLFRNDTNLWFVFGNGFDITPDPDSSSHAVPMLHVDPISRAANNQQAPWSPGSFFVWREDDQSVYRLGHGRRNGYNNKPLLDTYAYLEADTIETNVDDADINPDGYRCYTSDAIIFRGIIKHAVSGVMGEQPATQCFRSDGSVAMSTGRGYGWQGMNIKGAD